MSIDFKEVMTRAGIPTNEENLVAELRQIAIDENAPFLNKSDYSPFWRLVKTLMVKPLNWLIRLQYLEILPALFLKSAEGQWVDVFAWQLGLERKAAKKAKGIITLTRYSETGELMVQVGVVVQSDVINGEIYRLKVIKDGKFRAGESVTEVLCEAVETGAKYNLSTGFYAILSTSLAGIVQVRNRANWLVVPGADIETDDDLKERCRNQFAAVNMYHIDQSYISMLSTWPSVNVNDIYVESDAPRGPGTANLYILFDFGAPAQEYLEQMREHVINEGNHGFSDDVLIDVMPTKNIIQTVNLVFDSQLLDFEVDDLKIKIEEFIRVALRDMPSTNYQPTQTKPNGFFAWSKLIMELHQMFSGLVSVDFENDKDIKTGMWIPRINNLVIK